LETANTHHLAAASFCDCDLILMAQSILRNISIEKLKVGNEIEERGIHAKNSKNL
jgi:hypothetical protein